MPLVLDASVACKWFIQDERTARADAVLDRIERGDPAYVPALFVWEIANVLLSAERSGRIESPDVEEALEALRDAPISVEPAGERVSGAVELQLARAYDLTVYDAAYLVTAFNVRGDLATADSQLAAAARDLGIATIELF